MLFPVTFWDDVLLNIFGSTEQFRLEYGRNDSFLAFKVGLYEAPTVLNFYIGINLSFDTAQSPQS